MTRIQAKWLLHLLRVYKETYGEDAPDTMTITDLIRDLEDTV